MPQPPAIFPKPHASSRPPDPLSVPSAMVPYPAAFGSSQFTVEPRPHPQIYRTKRKHVLKACDRCRVKKTKCDGNQPCYRCAAYNHPCLFRERKVTQTKAYSKGFVEMLESHHALVVKALQQLYTHCINNKCFPGEPIDVVDGYPLTHAILDRLGLIKQAEKESEDTDSTNFELLQLWDDQHSASKSVDTDDLTPEASSGTANSPSSIEPPSPGKASAGPVKCESVSVEAHGFYHAFRCDEEAWSLDGQSGTTSVDQGLGVGEYYAEREVVSPHTTHHSGHPGTQSTSRSVQEQQSSMAVPGAFNHTESHTTYGIQHHPYVQGHYDHIGQEYSWNPGPWSR